MSEIMPILFTVGYGLRLKPADIIRLVKEHDPNASPIVVDVRDSRESRRNKAFDFRDREYVDRVEERFIPGCRYVWYRNLGNPSRKLPWAPELGVGAPEAMDLLATTICRKGDTVYAGPLVLLCCETDHRRCHRADIADELARRVPGLEVVHLHG